MSTDLSLLLVEDSESDAALVVRVLERAGFRVRSARVETAGEMQAALQQNQWDLVISDHNLPQFDARGALEVLQQSEIDIPFIVVSGAIQEQLAVEMMRAGAHDYLMKDNLLRLVPAVERELFEARAREQRREAQQALHEADRFCHEIIRCARDGIVVYGSDFTYRSWNPAMEKYTGYSAEEVLGRRPQDIFPFLQNSGVIETLEKTMQGEFPGPVEFSIQNPRTGKAGWFSDSMAPLRDTRNRIVGVIATVRDITEQKKIEAQLLQSHKMEAVGLLAGGIAHDFNNILCVLLMQLGLLQNAPQPAASLLEAFKDMERETLRARDLVRQLLTFCRKQAVEMHPLHLQELLRGLFKMLVRLLGEHITLKLEIPSGIPSVVADASMMEQMIINLCVNARDAMPQGGHLTLCVEETAINSEAAARHTERRMGNFVCLRVSDTGTGMDTETMPHIFEPFFTTKEPGKGTGLGLSSVYGIVQQHKGWIEVDSAPGKGSTFQVFLPASTEPVVGRDEQTKKSVAAAGRESILIVEDETALRNLAVRLLRSRGYRVAEASNGRQAVELWEQNEGRFDLLLSDMIMPEGITGLDLARRLTGTNRELKVILSSGYGTGPDHLDDSAFSGIVFLPKPYGPRDLYSAVRKCLDPPA